MYPRRCNKSGVHPERTHKASEGWKAAQESVQREGVWGLPNKQENCNLAGGSKMQVFGKVYTFPLLAQSVTGLVECPETVALPTDCGGDGMR